MCLNGHPDEDAAAGREVLELDQDTFLGAAKKILNGVPPSTFEVTSISILATIALTHFKGLPRSCHTLNPLWWNFSAIDIQTLCCKDCHASLPASTDNAAHLRPFLCTKSIV